MAATIQRMQMLHRNHVFVAHPAVRPTPIRPLPSLLRSCTVPLNNNHDSLRPQAVISPTGSTSKAPSAAGLLAIENTLGFELLCALYPLVPPAASVIGSLALLGVLPLEPAAINWALLTPTLFILGLTPVIDILLGERFALPEHDVEDLEASLISRSYARAVVVSVAEAAAVLLAPAAAAAAWNTWGAASLGTLAALVFGVVFITAISHGANHELLHSRASDAHKHLGRLMLSCYLSCGYITTHPHHHVHAGTPEDFVTARLNESYYQYLPRYIRGMYGLGWQLEAEKAQRKGRPVWNWSNAMIRGIATQLGFLVWSCISGGVPGLLTHAVIAVLSFCMLAGSDYFAHYGMARVRMPNGDWSPVTHHISFNSGFLMDNVLTFKVPFHSAHHLAAAKPAVALGQTPADLKRTAELRAAGQTGYEEAVSGQDGDRAPRLLPGVPITLVFNMVFIPALWFKYVNPLSEAANKAHRIAVGVEQPAA